MAERLPIKSYTTADGLPHNRVKRIVQDSHGFLWFCTAGGLSRFDGYQFTNYTAEDGLPAASVNDLLETSDGLYWVATNSDGVIRFNPLAVARHREACALPFIPSATNRRPIASMFSIKIRPGGYGQGLTADCFIWTKGKTASKFQRVPLGIPSHPDIQVQVWALVEDHAGSLWVGTTFGLVRRLPDGRMIHYTIQPSENRDTISALLVDKQGRLWLGHQSGLIVFNPEQASLLKGRSRGLNRSSLLMCVVTQLLGKDVEALCQTSDGRIWAAIFGGGLIEFEAKPRALI